MVNGATQDKGKQTSFHGKNELQSTENVTMKALITRYILRNY